MVAIELVTYKTVCFRGSGMEKERKITRKQKAESRKRKGINHFEMDKVCLS